MGESAMSKKHLTAEIIENLARKFGSMEAALNGGGSHVGACRACRARLEDAVTSRNLLTALPTAVRTPATLRRGIHELLGLSRPSFLVYFGELWTTAWFKPALAGAAILVALGSIHLYQPQPEAENPFAVEWVLPETQNVAENNVTRISDDEKVQIIRDLEKISTDKSTEKAISEESDNS